MIIGINLYHWQAGVSVDIKDLLDQTVLNNGRYYFSHRQVLPGAVVTKQIPLLIVWRNVRSRK
jgi:hypothetical protein